jgi:hypothetical protein
MKTREKLLLQIQTSPIPQHVYQAKNTASILFSYSTLLLYSFFFLLDIYLLDSLSYLRLLSVMATAQETSALVLYSIPSRPVVTTVPLNQGNTHTRFFNLLSPKQTETSHSLVFNCDNQTTFV